MRIGDVERENYVSAAQTQLDEAATVSTDEEIEDIRQGRMSDESRAKIEGGCMVFAAGPIAELRFRGQPLPAFSDDLDRMRSVAQMLTTNEMMANLERLVDEGVIDEENAGAWLEQRTLEHADRLGELARQLIFDQQVWKAVEAVATALDRDGYLPGRRAERIMQSAAPEAKTQYRRIVEQADRRG